MPRTWWRVGAALSGVVVLACSGCGVTTEDEPVRLDNGILGTPPTPTVTVLPEQGDGGPADDVVDPRPPSPIPASPAPRPTPADR